MTTTDQGIYYDPYDPELQLDPYPVFRRMREEAPLYYNERHDFYAVSRFDDVESALKDHGTFSSAHGGILELIKADIELPSGVFIFEDPPHPHRAPRPPLPGLHAQEDERPRAPDPRRCAPRSSIRSSAPTGSTSSPTSAPGCRCG